MAKVSLSRVPKNPFVRVEQINRHKRILLGLPVDRVKNNIPWGYFPDPADNWKLLPDERLLRLLLKAREYLVTCSLQEVSKWLSAEAKVPISYEGLRLLLRERCPFKEIMLPQDERERIYREPNYIS